MNSTAILRKAITTNAEYDEDVKKPVLNDQISSNRRWMRQLNEEDEDGNTVKAPLMMKRGAIIAYN
jgi:hypothetical protein